MPQLEAGLPPCERAHSSRPLEPRERTIAIEIRDASLEARIQKQLQAAGSSSVKEVLLRLLAP